MKKRRKLFHFTDVIKNFNFIDCHRVTAHTGEKGTRYLLDGIITKEQKNMLEKYDNVIIGSAHYRYSPNIEYSTLILLD